MPIYKTYNDVPVKKYKTYDDVKVKAHWEEDASQPLDADTVANNPLTPALTRAKKDGNTTAAKQLLDTAPYNAESRAQADAYADTVITAEKQAADAKNAAVQATIQPMGYGGLSKALRDRELPKKETTKVKETLREGNPTYNADYVSGVDYPKFREQADIDYELDSVEKHRAEDIQTRYPEAAELTRKAIAGDAAANEQLQALAARYADENAAYDARIAELKKEVKDSKNKTVVYRREREAAGAAAAETERFGDAALADVGNGIKAALGTQRAAEAAQREADAAETALHDYEDTLRANGISEQYFGEDSHYIELAQAASTAKKSADAQKNAADADLYTLRGAQTLAELPEEDRAAVLNGVLAMRGNSAAGMNTSIPQTFDFSTGEYRILTEDEFKQIRADYSAVIRKLKASGVSNADIRRMETTLNQSADAMIAAGGSVRTAEFALQYPVLASAISVIANLASGVTAAGGEVARTVGNAFRDEGYQKPMNIYGVAYAPTRATNDIRGTIAERIEEGNGTAGKFGSFAYQTLMSSVDSVVASVLGNVGGAAAIGGSAYASAIVDAKEKGETDAQALATGIAAGIFETLFERVSIGNFNALKEVPAATVRDVAKNVVKSTVVNASEEAATEIANIIADAIIGGDLSGYAEAYNGYLAEGSTPSEAKRKALLDMAKQVGMAALGGAVQGGFMGGIGTTWGYFSNRDANREAGSILADRDGRVSRENTKALIGEGLASKNEEIRSYAKTLEGKRSLSQAQAGQLYRMLVAEEQGEYETVKNQEEGNGQRSDAGLAKELFNDANSSDHASAISILRANIPILSDMESVAEVSGQEIRQGGKATDRLLDFIEKIGNAVTRQGFGTVLFSKTRLKNSVVGHGAGESKIELFAAVPSVISNGTQISKAENWKGRGYDSYVFAAPVDYKGKRVYVTAIVTKGADNRYYLHEAVDSEGNLLYGHEESPASPSDRSAAKQNTVANAGLSDSAYSTDTDSIPQSSPARQPAMPDFSGRSLDEPISDAEFRAAYEARIAREIAAERARAETDNVLGDMLSGEMTNDRADAIAKSQALATAFEKLTGTALSGTLAQKRKQIKSMRTYAAELLRSERAEARMDKLAKADTREKMRTALGSAGAAAYDAGYAAGVAEYRLRLGDRAAVKPVEAYNATFARYYRQGYRGGGFDLQTDAVIAEREARQFYEAGRRDAKADTYLNATERSAAAHGVSAEAGATARRLSQALDRKILFIDGGEDFHGCTSGGVIYLGAKSNRTVLQTVAHEYTHLLESKALYGRLRDFVFETMRSEGGTAEDLRAAKRAEHEIYANLSDADTDREIVAAFVETRLLTDENTLREVVRREGKPFARRLLDTLRGLVEKVKAALHLGGAEAEQLRVLERGRDILAEVVQSEETSGNADGAISFAFTGTNKNGVREYKTDFPAGMPQAERERLFKERLATIFNLGAVELKTDVKKIKVQADRFTYGKNRYGDIGNSENRSAKVNALYDLVDILETSIFKSVSIEPSFASESTPPKNMAHKDVKYWYKFENHIVLDGIPYKVVFNIRDKGKEQYQYLIEFSTEDSQSVKKKTPTSDTAVKGQLRAFMQRSSDTTVAQKNSDVNTQFMQNSENDAEKTKFSVGGVKAETADIGRLSDASRMESDGADSEEIRQATGWYRGYDGKWRFEIDDSRMRFINHREESRRTWHLDELIRHDALFAAYPELRDYTVLNFGVSDDADASFYPGLNRITLDPRLSRAEKRTALIHEIQHAIQMIEGFPAGATTEYWRDRLVTDEERQLSMRLRDFDAPDGRFRADMRTLLEDTPPEKQAALRASLTERYGEATVREYAELYSRLRDLQQQREQRAERAYRSTAGEIEARDVASRLDMTANQREETRPDIDREDVKYANIHPLLSMEARKAISDFVDEAIDNKGRTDEERNQIRISRAPQNIVDDVYRASAGEINISGKYFALEGSKLYHEYIRHSDQDTEHARGQVPLSLEDIKKAAEIFYSPDIVECIFADTDNPTQQQSFALAKEAEDGSHYVLVVESVGGKRNPNIVPAEMLKIKPEKWNRYIGAGKSIADMVYANETAKRAAIKNNVNNINNRVTVARLSAQNAQPASSTFSSVADTTVAQKNSDVNTQFMQNTENDADIRYSVGEKQQSEASPANPYAAITNTDAKAETGTDETVQTDAKTTADAEVTDTDKRFAPVESAIRMLKSGADMQKVQWDTRTSPREIALRMAVSGESDAEIRRLTGLYRVENGVWACDSAWMEKHIPDLAENRALRAGYKYGAIDERLLGLAPEDVKASRRRLLDGIKLPSEADAARTKQTADALRRVLRPTEAEFAETRRHAAAKEAARLITEEKVPSADAAIRTGALLADIADVLEKKKYNVKRHMQMTGEKNAEKAEEYCRKKILKLTGQVRGEDGAWTADDAAMIQIIRAGSKQLKVQDFTNFLFDNAKKLSESSYNSQYGMRKTYALNKLGIKIQNPIVDIASYGEKPSELIASEREQAALRYYMQNSYAQIAKPTSSERADAQSVAAGSKTLAQIAPDSRREVVLDLVYANLARRGLKDGGIETFYMVQKQRYAEELAQKIFTEPIAPGAKPVWQGTLTANTALRNNRMVFGDAVGRYLNETIFEKVVDNEAERQRFMQREIDKIAALKLTKLESAAVQMLAEDTKESRLAFYELLKGKGKDLDIEKCRAAVTTFRECYNLYYDAINEFLVMHGYAPIGFQKNYMPHLQKEADITALRERLNALGIETEAVTELPAEIAGRTEEFKPGKKYDPYLEHRTSKKNKNVQYDALAGFDSYISYLSEVLYHTDDIQKLRTLANTLRERYASGAVSEEISKLKEELYSPDPDRDLADIERRLSKAYDKAKVGTYFGTYAIWLDEYTNSIAGKQAGFDRAIERTIGRKELNLGGKLSNIYSAAVIVGNLSSAFNQTVQLPFALTECGIRSMTRAFVDMLPRNDRLNKVAEFDKKSTFLAGKRGVDYASERAWNEKVTAAGGKFFEAVDMAVTRLILRAKYYQVTEANPDMRFDEALREADRYISDMVGNRMKGAKPVLFNSKNVIVRTLTAFQLESLNFAEYVARDVPAKYRAYQKVHGTPATVRKIARELLSALINVFVFNRLAELLYGQTPAAGDALGILVDSLGAGWNLTGNDFLLTLADDLCQEMTGQRKLGTRERGKFSAQNALGEFGGEVGDDVPLLGNILAMFGVTDSKLPLPQVKAVTKAAEGDFSGAAKQILPDAATWVPFGSQIKKTARGAQLIAEKGMYSSSGKLMFASDMNLWDCIRAVLFGPTANEEYQESFFGGRYLSEEETATWQKMRAAGGKPKESFDALQDVYNAGAAVREADPDAEAYKVKEAKVEQIDNLPLDGRLKALILYGDVASENEKAVMDTLEVTLQVDSDKAYRFMSGFVLEKKITEKREYLKHDLILSDTEKAAVWYGYFANEDMQDFMDELRRRGARDADIYKVLAASYSGDGKVSAADRATAIAESALPDTAKEEAMYELISESLHDKYAPVQEAGGNAEEFLAAYAATRGVEADKDKNGNAVYLSKARKMKKAIDAAVPDTSKKVRRALYRAFGVSESVWY